MYMKNEGFDEAWSVFSKIKIPNVVTWNTFLSGFVQHGRGQCALAIFDKMQCECIIPDEFTFSSVLKACGIAQALDPGKEMHDVIVRSGFDKHLVIGNAIADMYVKCDSLVEAFNVFNGLRCRDIVSWGTMLTGCIDYGFLDLNMLNEMELEGLSPTNLLYLPLLKECGNAFALRQARLIHCQIARSGLEIDILVGSTLIDVYVKCGMLEDALWVFNQLPKKDIVSWNTIITGFVQNEDFHSGLGLFMQMQLDGWKPNENTCSAVLKTCGTINTIELGKLIHDMIIKNDITCDTILGNILVYMYAKCGALEEAREVLKQLPIENVGSWGALINGCADHDEYILAHNYFEEMQLRGVSPDDKSYTSMLSTCSHKGDVEGGYGYITSMQVQHRIIPTIEHLNCMVDLLASRGYLKESFHLLERMPNLMGWMSLLIACRRYGDIICGKQCFDRAIQLDSTISAAYVLMRNMWNNVTNRRVYGFIWSP